MGQFYRRDLMAGIGDLGVRVKRCVTGGTAE